MTDDEIVAAALRMPVAAKEALQEGQKALAHWLPRTRTNRSAVAAKLIAIEVVMVVADWAQANRK